MSKAYFLILSFLVISLKQGPQAVDWCSLDCITRKGNVKNTLCTYPHRKSTFSCHSIRDTNNPDTIKEILHLHNKYRSAIAGGEKGWPSAANMRQMTWDHALEALALRWAQQCKPGHDECRRTPDFHVVGQNYCVLANWKYYVDGPQPCFDGWIQGMSTATEDILESFKGGIWADFAQVVWADSHKVGCAQVHFRQSGRGVHWKKTALVCNYGPGGNIISKQVYKTGPPCSKCPNNTSCRPTSLYPNLCARPDDPVGPKDMIDDNIYNTPQPKRNRAVTATRIKFENPHLFLIPMVVLRPFRHRTSTGTCRNIRSSLTPDKRKELLHLHNQFRNYMAAGLGGWPAAANMRQMSWDTTLELVALRWAEQCKKDPDQCRRTPEFQDVGQNYGMLATATVHPDSSKGSFDGWSSWMFNTNQSLLSSYRAGDWGVFTQIVWANTYKLGCAQVQYSEKQDDVDWKRTVLVCNYGPAGNLVGRRIYEEGSPCTKCIGNTVCKPSSSYPNLCALPTDNALPNLIGKSGGSKIEIFKRLACILIIFTLYKNKTTSTI